MNDKIANQIIKDNDQIPESNEINKSYFFEKSAKKATENKKIRSDSLKNPTAELKKEDKNPAIKNNEKTIKFHTNAGWAQYLSFIPK